MKRKLSLIDRAYIWGSRASTRGAHMVPARVFLARGYIAGYKAAQRDARKNRAEETNGDYPG